MHLFIAFYAVWIVLSEQGGVFFLIAGAVSSGIALLLARRMGAWKPKQVPLYFYLRVWRYIVWLMKEVVVSGLQVARIVLRPKLSITPMLGHVPVSPSTESGLAAYATSITLTPGTVSVGVKHGRIVVHALDKEIYCAMDEETIGKKIIQEIER